MRHHELLENFLMIFTERNNQPSVNQYQIEKEDFAFCGSLETIRQ